MSFANQKLKYILYFRISQTGLLSRGYNNSINLLTRDISLMDELVDRRRWRSVGVGV